MNYAALFTFIMRLVGLYFLFRAATEAIVLLNAVGLLVSSGVRTYGPTSVLLLIGHLLAAMWFFKGAPPYGGWAYKELAGKKDDA